MTTAEEFCKQMGWDERDVPAVQALITEAKAEALLEFRAAFLAKDA